MNCRRILGLRWDTLASVPPAAVAVALVVLALPNGMAQSEEDIGERVERLIVQLGDQDAGARRDAADGLGLLPDPGSAPRPFAPAIQALMPALGDEDATVRASVVQALGNIVHRTRSASGAEPAIPVLIDLLSVDGDANVRGHAARTLACIALHIADGQALRPASQPLTRALRDEARFDRSGPDAPPSESRVCSFAAIALSWIAPRIGDGVPLGRALPFLVDALEDPEKDWRPFAGWVLEQAVSAVKEAPGLQVGIAKSVEGFGDGALRRVKLMQVLAELGPRKGVAQQITWLRVLDAGATPPDRAEIERRFERAESALAARYKEKAVAQAALLPLVLTCANPRALV